MERTQISRRKGGSILMVDDDVELCTMMTQLFEDNDFRFEVAHDGSAGLAKALEGKHDLILLDVMLPRLDGFHVLQHLRRRAMTPVILLTARSERQDRIAGLESGADYYVCKPFDPDELLATVRAVLRRAGQTLATKAPAVEVGEIKLNSRTREVSKGSDRIEVTSAEFDILDILMRSAGRVVSRDELAAVLYHRKSTPFEHSLEVHISHLRRKLETGERLLIRTVRGVGYLLSPPGEE
jgi:two-component system response regulator CpxR